MRRTTLAAAFLACAAFLGGAPFLSGAPFLGGAAQAAAASPGAGASPGTGATASVTAAASTDPEHLVVVGTWGLEAADLSPTTTPRLWATALAAVPGNLAVRSVRPVTCPADGWLALSAGTRVADDAAHAAPSCRTLAQPGPGGAVPAWGEYVAAAADQDYDASLGALGAAVAASGTTATAIGPGAAIALARPDGTVAGRVRALPDAQGEVTRTVADAVRGSWLVVVDLGGAGEGADGLAGLDARVDAVLVGATAGGTGTRVLLASLADGASAPRLQLAVDVPPGLHEGTELLTSASTRQPGLGVGTDLLATVADALGITTALPADARTGAVLHGALAGHGDQEARLDALVDGARRATVSKGLAAPFYAILGVVAGAFVVGAMLLPRLSARSRAGRWVVAHRDAVARGVVAAGLVLGAVPVASTLANLVPWWRPAHAGLVLTAVTLVVAGALAAATLALGRWAHLPARTALWPAGVVGAVTALVLAADVATGARLQLGALMGAQPLVAGRFYGFTNTTYAVFAVGAVLAATAVGDALVRSGRRRAAAAAVALIGVCAVVVDGAPGLGADFGGPPGLVAGFGVLALVAAGVRLTWRRVALVLVAAVAVVALFAVADYLRPAASRTHLGGVVDDLLHGRLAGVVGRKLADNLGNLVGNPWVLVGVVAVGAVLLLARAVLRATLAAPDGTVLRPQPDGVGQRDGVGQPNGVGQRDGVGQQSGEPGQVPWRRLADDAPLARAGATATVLVLVLGMLLNDSGVLVAATGALIWGPLVVATWTAWAASAARDPEP